MVSGEKESLRIIYESHVDAMYGYGMSLVKDKNRVEDAIQEIILRIWTNRSSLSRPKNLKSYLLICLRNELFKKKPFDKTIEFEAHHESTGEESIEEKWIIEENEDQLQNEVKAALQELPKRHQEVVQLKYVENLGYEEIAEIMQVNYQSARNLVHRALNNLRKKIKK